MIIALATALGVAAGCIDAVAWATGTIGTPTILIFGAFIAGCVITAAVFAAAGRTLR